MPTTPAGRTRQLEKVARRREHLQREIATVRKREAALAAAVRADREKAQAGYERSVGRMLLAILEEKRALADGDDDRTQRNIDCWMGNIDAAVTDPAEREVAGLDAREPHAPPEANLEAVLAHLNRERIRCTYKALGGLLGVAPAGVARLLGPRRPEASWVVNARTGLPTGYSTEQMHPDLQSNPAIIADADGLRKHTGLGDG